MKRLVAAGCIVCAGIVLAMPTRKDLAKAQEMVNDVTASDVKALKAGTKKPAEVAATHMDLAAKANSEAEKYLLLQGAFNLSAKAGDFDAAADALEAMVKEIPDMRPDVIVEIYNKAIFRSMKEKAPRLYAIKEAARKAAANRKRLPELEKAAKAKPQDAKAQKALGECHAELGDWDKALAAFAKADGELAKKAKAELDGTLKPQELADFWWDYNEDANAYRLHAVTFYRDALADDGFQGLARERAERRIKEMEADNTVVIAKRQDDEPVTKLVVPSVSYKGGETIKVLLNSKKRTELEFAAIPSGEFTTCPRVPAEWRERDQKWNVFTTWDKPHKVRLTYPFLMMKGPLSYAEADAIDLQTALKGHAKFTSGTESIIPDSPVMELSWNDIQCLIRKLNESVRLPVNLRRFQGYAFRLPTEAEWQYAMRGGSDAKDCGDFASWTKEWGGYWWGKLPNGVSGQKGSYHPFAPVPSMRNTANPWGLYYLGPKTIYADTYSGRDVKGKPMDFRYLQEDVFRYEETEVNPVRINNGADAVHYVVYAGALPKLSPFDIPVQQCPFRLVFAPKLSLLNVYPRQSAGTVTTSGGGAAAPAKTDATITQKEPIRLALDSNAKNTMTFNFCPFGSATVGKITCSVTKGFYMETVPVTRRQWFSLQRKPVQAWKGGEDAPMTYVSREEVDSFCQNLTRRFASKLPRGYVVRLPTVAEWYLAYQKGETKPHADDEKALRKACDELGWFGQGVDGNSGSAGMRRYYLDANMPIPLVADVWTEFPPKKIEVKKGWVEHSSQFAPVPVGLKKANKLGLHDMLGNCFEMTYDGAAESNASEGTYGVFGYSYGKEIYRGIGTDLVDPVHLAGDGILSVGNPLAPDGGVYIWAAAFERSPNIGLRLCLAPPVKTAMP